MSDNRTTLTDAVATLGTIINMEQKRDAIHLATEPVFAAEKLYPGQDIGLLGDGTATAAPGIKKVGIVDPFLDAPVFPGQRFWLIVYPRQITSLRHTWEHPDFPSTVEPVTEEPTALTDAIRYVEGRAENWSTTYQNIMDNARDCEGEDEVYTNNGYMEADEDFWEAYSTITGREVTLRGYIDDGCRGC